MYLKITSLILGLGLSQWAMAAITLTVPEEIVVLSINQKEVKPSFFRTGKKYTIEGRDVVILARYQQYFDHRNSQHDILKSDVLAIHATDLADQQQYALKLVDAPKNFDDARKYVEQPKITLVDAQQKVRSIQSETQIKAPSILNQLFGTGAANSNVVIAADSTPQKTSEIALPRQAKAAENTVNAMQSNTSAFENNSNKTSSDLQLIKIWQQASKVERQKFLTWLAEQ